LAEHRAVFAARRQVDEALRIVATALDADRQTVEHGAALNRGLRAMAEADQFLPRGRTVAADIRTADLVVGHETPVLKNSDPSRVTCWQARAAYLDYARSEMARAMDGEFAGSMALLALGKLQAAPAGLGAEGSNADWDKAAMLHRAALDVSPHNVLAANDLAVLLADRGELHEARRLLEAVARQSRLAEAWHNLASVCHRMGDGRSGAQAAEQARVCARERASGEPARSARVMWLAPGQFGPPASDAPAEVADGTSAQPEGSDEGSLAGWPAWRLLRRK
jgi:tetratricopeptide (TPR) repeat protein